MGKSNKQVSEEVIAEALSIEAIRKDLKKAGLL